MKKNVLLMVSLVLAGCASLIPLKVGPPRDIKVEITEERIARGEYLATAVTACIHCHSKLDWDDYGGGFPEPGTEGAGGWHIVESMGIMGGFDLYASNITPSALGDWTDGELIRAIVEGVNKKGEPLFPIMPYGRYVNMDEEDLYSIVAYVRSLKPVANPLPQKKVKRLFKYVERTFPQPYDPKLRPDPSDRVPYGNYLATIGDCISCHTPTTGSGKPLEGMHLAGGSSFPLPGGGVVYSSNLTPDPETGIREWSEDDFIDLFNSFQEPVKVPEYKKGENTVMPWPAYSGMTEEDLGAIFEYLQSVKPVKHKVEKWPARE